MRNFQDTFKSRKPSFIIVFSICMTVPLIVVNYYIFVTNDVKDFVIRRSLDDIFDFQWSILLIILKTFVIYFQHQTFKNNNLRYDTF